MLEIPPCLVSYETGSFLFDTFSKRIPGILTKVVNSLNIKIYDDKTNQDELSNIIFKISKLRHELLSNKPLIEPFVLDNYIDSETYNNQLKFLVSCENPKIPLNWFNCPSLQAECYIYRKLFECFKLSENYGNFDYFKSFKNDLYENSYTKIKELVIFTEKSMNSSEIDHNLTLLLQCIVWSNRADLSLSGGDMNTTSDEVQSHINTKILSKLSEKYLLCNDLPKIIAALKNSNVENKQVDYILDNIGIELVSDLCLVYFLIESKLVSRVNFHVKRIPWFISDVTVSDFYETVEKIKTLSPEISGKFHMYMREGTINVQDHIFWTSAYSYFDMSKIAPDLYNDLKKSYMCIFKGDLNYRKLINDRDWPLDTEFKKSLCGFEPCKVCAFRTLKCNTLAGLPKQSLSLVPHLPENWMYSGEYAVIQYTDI